MFENANITATTIEMTKTIVAIWSKKKKMFIKIITTLAIQNVDLFK